MMEKQEIIDKLGDIGIVSTNCAPRSTWMGSDGPVFGMYPNEMSKDFYFWNKFDGIIYKMPGDTETVKRYPNKSGTQHIVTLSDATIVWEDIPFVEREDKQYNQMTLREYACIQLEVPDSGILWLDELIRKSKVSKNTISS